MTYNMLATSKIKGVFVRLSAFYGGCWDAILIFIHKIKDLFDK